MGKHPDVRAAERRLDQAREAVREARAPLFPQLRLTGEYGFENVDSPVRRNAGGDAVVQSREIGRFEVTQKIFDGFGTDGQLKAAINREFQAGYGLERSEQQLMLRATTAYLSVLRQTELVDISLATEGTIRRQLALEDERVRRGSGLSVDVLQSKSRLQNAKEQRVQLEGQLRSAVAEYVAVFHHAPEIGAMEPPIAPNVLLPLDLDVAIDRAFLVNPVMKQSQERIGEARQQHKTAISDFMPDVNLVAEGGLENDAEGITGNRRELFVGVRADWNIFNGFATVAAGNRTQQRVAETMENHASLSREVAKRVEVAWQALVTLRERQALAENAAAIASELFVARTRLRGAGRDSVVNVLDAEREVNAARSRAAAARYDSLIQTFRLLFEIGDLGLDAYSD
ncbi:MAG: TolC family protein [Minwuia sp.]|nr:TolC family protein [Minwuia sp.]